MARSLVIVHQPTQSHSHTIQRSQIRQLCQINVSSQSFPTSSLYKSQFATAAPFTPSLHLLFQAIAFRIAAAVSCFLHLHRNILDHLSFLVIFPELQSLLRSVNRRESFNRLISCLDRAKLYDEVFIAQCLIQA